MEVQNSFQIVWDKTPYRSFTDYFFAKIGAHGSNLAIVDVDTGKQWRYSEIRGWCDMCAMRLKELQVTINSRVAVITGTTGQAIFVHLACSLIGCSAVAVNGWNTVDEIWQLVDLSESTHLIVEPQFQQKADDVRRKAVMRGGGRIKHVRVIDDVLTSESISSEENGLEEDSEAPSHMLTPVNTSNAINPMLIFFTSGTTGLPKVSYYDLFTYNNFNAAELAHRSLIINIQQMSLPLYGPVQAKERFLLALSISHIFGAVSAYYALVNGAIVHMMSKVFPRVLIETLTKTNINVSHITPAMLMWLARDPALDDVKMPNLRSLIVGGAPVDCNLANLAKQKMNLKDMRQTYGMTELGGLCTLSHYEYDNIESVGSPLPGMLFKVVNWETKQLCGPRQPGQLMVIGPQVMPSYFKNPKATNELLDSNGYIKTGDAAFYDENGHLYVLDRIKDIIKYKGTLVCPSEVELILRAHPGIDDCAVVGRQDHVAGEVPAAFVVKSSSHPLLASAEVRQYVSGKIATFKELRGGVFFISEIPRSVCGKVSRRQLRQFWDRERNNSKVEGPPKDAKQSKENKTPTVKTNGLSHTPTKKTPLSRTTKK
uniref:AMP-binding domain-containing protein n=1 Tax=Heterorhabditis bacteriophora TaxID=37862 RepID=A0A1I7X7G8_HETBA